RPLGRPGKARRTPPPGSIFAIFAEGVFMIAAKRRIPTVVALACCGWGVATVGLGQESGQTVADSEPRALVGEEFIVHGRSPAELRVQLELAEEAVYARFNEINSSDEFDFRCRN